MSLKLPLLLCVLGLWLVPCRGDGGGWIAVRFVSFENPDGVGANGHCCDGKWGICQVDGCDHVFTTCLHNDTNASDGFIDPDDCAYFRVKRGPVYNEDSVIFGDHIGEHQNPLVVGWTEFPEALQLKVLVEDDDGVSENELVSFHSLDVNASQIALTRASEGQDFVIDEQPRLTVNIRTWCAQGLYGERCDIECVPEPEGQYVCDPETGDKYCNIGHSDGNCD